MKVQKLKSLSAKLFYLMTALVLITVAGNSWQFFRTFKTYQLQQLQDSLQSQAERAKDQVDGTLETWRSQIAVALPTLRGTDSKESKLALQRFVDASPEFVFIQLWTAPNSDSTNFTPLGDAFTSHTNDKNFEDKDPVKLSADSKTQVLEYLKATAPLLKKSNYTVESFGRILHLPILVMATKFEVAGSTDVVWAVLGSWQTNLIKAMLKSATLNSAMIDSKGRIFTSLDPTDIVERPLLGSKTLLKKVLAASAPSGFESEYKDAHGHLKVGAYSHLPRYNLTVVVEEDAGAATQTIKKTLISTSLWAALFILFAVMFSFVGSSGITKGLRAVTFATTRIAAGDLNYQIAKHSDDEVGVLGESVNHMSRRITALMHAQVDKARFEKELETAKMVQSTFFPKAAIRRPHFSVNGFYTPASECGGDLWGHFTISDGVEFVFIADAMGHGAPAALVTAMAYSTTMTVADIIKHDLTYREAPGALLERLNRIIYEAVQGKISMTFFASIIDLNRGIMTYANAGHNFPAILPLDAADSRLGKASKQSQKRGGIQPISLKLMGNPLGIDPTSTFKEQSCEFKAGDKIFYFTDGLIECTSPKGEAWGRKQLLLEVGAGNQLSSRDLCNTVVKKAFAFFGGKPLDDDITVVVAEIARDWQKRPADAPLQAAPETTPETRPEAAAALASGDLLPPLPLPLAEVAAASSLSTVAHDAEPAGAVSSDAALDAAVASVEAAVASVEAAIATTAAAAPLLSPSGSIAVEVVTDMVPAAAVVGTASQLVMDMPASRQMPTTPAATRKYKLKLPSVG